MTTLNLHGFRRAQRRAFIKMAPAFVYVGLVAVSLGIVGTLSFLSLSA